MSPPWTSATAEARNVSKSGCSSCMSGEGSSATSAGGKATLQRDGDGDAGEHEQRRGDVPDAGNAGRAGRAGAGVGNDVRGHRSPR